MRKALIIDDTKNIRIMLTKCLEISGYNADTATNGIEGMKLLEDFSYDLIFLDIKLPELSGTEVLKRIRGKGINTPVIIITAYPTIKNAVECTRLGAVSYLQKPFTAERLKNTLQSLNLDFSCGGNEREKESNFDKEFEKVYEMFLKNPANPEIYNILAKIFKDKKEYEKAEKFIKIKDILSL